MINLTALNSMNTPIDLARVPYDFIGDRQSIDCTIDTEEMFHLRAIMRGVPSMCVEDRDEAGDAFTRWVSRTDKGSYLFVEICELSDKPGRYFVTSFIDDLSCLKGYVEINESV